MPVALKHTLQQVVEHVAAMDPDIDRRRVDAMVRETIGALGLLVNARNDEVYIPADAHAPRPATCPQCGDGVEDGHTLCTGCERTPAPRVQSAPCYCGSRNHPHGACAKGSKNYARRR